MLLIGEYKIITRVKIVFFLFSSMPCSISAQPMFSVLNSIETNIYFFNDYKYFKNPIEGNGVGVGDFNNDGLTDIFFVGTEKHALYINKGDFKFEDIIEKSGIMNEKGGTCATISDINNDGFDDIIIAFQQRYYSRERKTGISVYINNRNLGFSDKAEKMQLIVNGNLSSISVTDINKDGLLDLLVSLWNVSLEGGGGSLPNFSNQSFSDKFIVDRIFLNSGNSFEDKTEELNLFLKAKVHTAFRHFPTDINQDGFPDIFIPNDFDAPDYFFINENSKKFSEKSETLLKTTCFSSMGVDIADINNDGLLDIFTCDMRPVNNYRTKTLMFEAPFLWYQMYEKNGNILEKQKVKNTLQLNNGNTSFSEISELANVDATDWSWSPLLADFDNDGYKDLFITAGQWFNFYLEYDSPLIIDSIKIINKEKNITELLSEMDTLQYPFYKNGIFKNNGNLTFSNMQKDWGMNFPLSSRGAAYADFDNDGDLDIVVSNSKSKSFIYKNNSEKILKNNFLRIILKNEKNLPSIHSTATIFYNEKMQFLELQPVRGFYSTSENIFHFGLGKQESVDSLIITWPDGNIETIKNVKSNHVLTVNYSNSTSVKRKNINETMLFSPTNNFPLCKHKENDFIDFTIDPLLPQFYSRSGPSIASGDLNNDGKEDFIVGGAHNQPTNVIISNIQTFRQANIPAISNDSVFEDMGILIFDANSDGLNDIYIASGGYEFENGSDSLLHRLYLNDGNGNFKRSNNIPKITTSASCVIANDFDNDGDLDLFIGGRVSSHHYPLVPESYLLRNNNGKFSDVTDSIAPQIKKIGMVNSALFTDFNNDNFTDLIVVGEYMPICFFKNLNGKKFEKQDEKKLIPQRTEGFWNSIAGGDFDNDGDIDYIVGNLGLNTRWKASQENPLELFANDFDENGSIDIITSYRENGKTYPTKQLNSYKQRINGLAKKYYRHSLFAEATVYDMFSASKFSDAIHLSSYETATCILINDGNGKFNIKKLPAEAQFAPVFGVVADDFDEDDNLDLMLVGNFFSTEVERGRYTALKGLILSGDGNGGFKSIPPYQSGFIVEGDAKGLARIDFPDSSLYIATQNNDQIIAYQKKHNSKVIAVPDSKKYVVKEFPRGKKRKEEIYFGSGYLSQSNRKIKIGKNVLQYEIH